MQGKSRKAEFQTIEKQYQDKISKNPYTEINFNKQQFHPKVSRGVYARTWIGQKKNYDAQALSVKQEAIKNLNLKHFKQDGFNFVNPGALQRDAAQLVGDISKGRGINYRNISSRGKKQVELLIAKEDLLYGRIDKSQYNKRVGRAQSVYKKQEQRAKEERSKQARAKAVGDLAKDSEKWDDVSKNFSNQKAVNDSFSVQPNPNYDDMTQKEYTTALREGKVNLATALLNQRTAGGYKGPNTVNIETFLTERGYDISKPETIPDSIFKPEKQLAVRAQAKSAAKNNSEMGDLRLLSNTYQKVNVGPNNFFGATQIKTKKFKANDPLEFIGPSDKRKIENFKLIDSRPLSLTDAATASFGRDMKTGEIKRLKTVGETYSPEMQFFGQFIQGSRNTFDSYGNLLTNTGNFLTGKPQQPLARPPVQDQFFGAVIDSAKNTFEGKSENRASDPMGEFFNTQQKRIDRVGYGQVAGELTTEALFWALPVGGIAKIPKIATSFFSPTVKATKASKAYTPGGDFMKLEGKTKDVSWGDQLGAFFGPKGNKVKSQPFVSSNVPLGKGTTKPKGKKGNNFFSGSSGTGKKPGNFFDEPPKTTKTNTGLELVVKTQQKTKKGNPPKKYSYDDFLKYKQKYTAKAIQLQKQKAIPKTKVKQNNQFFKVSSKQKQLTKSKQQFFKPIPLITPKTKVKQKQQQEFFKTPTKQKVTPKLTPKLNQKKKYQQTGVIAPYFPPTAKTTGMFLPPLPFFRQGGVRSRKGRGKRPAKKAFTAWNVNTKQVGSFLKGPTYKKSRSDYIFKDLDKRTKKAKKEKDYDYLDFF